MDSPRQRLEQSCAALAAALVPDAEEELAAYAGAVHVRCAVRQSRLGIYKAAGELR